LPNLQCRQPRRRGFPIQLRLHIPSRHANYAGEGKIIRRTYGTGAVSLGRVAKIAQIEDYGLDAPPPSNRPGHVAQPWQDKASSRVSASRLAPVRTSLPISLCR
jgi:hypothetical protein